MYVPKKGPTVNSADKNASLILEEWQKLQEFITSIKDKVLFKSYISDGDLYKTVLDDLKKNIQIMCKI